MLDKIHIYITILAAAVITSVGIITGMPLIEVVIRLIYVIVIFYFLGLFVRAFLKKQVFPEEMSVDSNDDEASDEPQDSIIDTENMHTNEV